MALTRVLTLEDAEDWKAYADLVGGPEVVYLPQYAAVFQDHGDGAAECFVYEDELGLVVYPYIRRPLPADIAGAAAPGSCDLATPYGYGGFVHRPREAGQDEALLVRFRRAFEGAMAERRVVSEFIRFHPLLQNQSCCGGMLPGVDLHKSNVFWDLTKPPEQLFRQCRETYRHEILKAREAGLHLERDEGPQAIADFAALYGQTMARHAQRGYLNFPPSFFHHLCARLDGHVAMFRVHDGRKALASAIFLLWGSYVDYFLAASSVDERTLHPNHLLLYEVALWAKERGSTLMHLGGGSDQLLFFKSGFSKERRPYFLGRHVHDEGAYRALTEARRRIQGLSPESPIPYFPAYRFATE